MVNIRSTQNEIPIDTKLRNIDNFVVYVNGNPEYIYVCGCRYQESIFYFMYRQMFFENKSEDYAHYIVRCDSDWTLRNLIKSMYGESQYHTFKFYTIKNLEINLDVTIGDWGED